MNDDGVDRRRFCAGLAVLMMLAGPACRTQTVDERLDVASDPTFVEAKGEVIEGFPSDFPAYPGASLVGSALANRPGQPTAGFRVKWETRDGIADVMAWFARELPKAGWTYEPPTDDSPGERIGHLRRNRLEGYIEAERDDSGETEIVVDLKFRPAVRAAATAPASATAALTAPVSFRFGASGDFTLNEAFQSVTAAVKTANPAFFVALGDFAYDTIEQSWCEQWTLKAKYTNVLLVSGNHDSGESPAGNINTYLKHCPQPFATAIKGPAGKQYYFDYPLDKPFARFIMVSAGLKDPKGFLGIDTNYDKNPGFTFVSDAIDGARSIGIKWIVVGMHKNYISVMGKHNEISKDGRFMTMLLDKRVDLILQGHEHGYERTKQLATDPQVCKALVPDAFNPACVVDSDEALVKGTGTVILVLGTGGKDLRNIDENDVEGPYFAALDVTTFGFGDFVVTPTSLSFEFKRAAGKSFKDQFTITEVSPGAISSGS